MKEYVEITNDIVRMFDEAMKFDSDFISIGLFKNKFIIAIEGVRGMFCIADANGTEHEEFSIRVEKKLLNEIFKKGFLKINVPEGERIVDFKLFLTESGNPWIEAVIPYSFAPSVKSMSDMIFNKELINIKVSSEIFSNRISTLLEKTGEGFCVTGKFAYSVGPGISMYLGLRNECENGLSMDLKTYNMLSKLDNEACIYYKVDNSYIMQRGNKYYIWRGEYLRNTDVEKTLDMKPLSVYKIVLGDECPFVFSKINKNDNTLKAILNITEDTLTLRSLNANIKVSIAKEVLAEYTPVKTIEFKQEYLRYMSAKHGVFMGVFKKFIRISIGDLIMDFGSEIKLG